MSTDVPVKEESFDFDADTLNAAIAAAPEAGFVNVNFGRLTIKPMIVEWGAKDTATGKSKKVVRALRPGEKSDNIEIHIIVDIREFNQALEFDYDRNVPLRKSSDRGKSDWTEIVEPALVQLLGQHWTQVAKTHPYVAVEDVPNVNKMTSKSTGKVYNVPKLIAVYSSMLECKTARDARYSGSSKAADEEMKSVVEMVRGLISAVGGNLEEVRPLLDTEPYNKYNAEQLIVLAMI